ncbi:MAG: efflux RND transporter periplasmic adaptor subunit [Rhodospirillales bacterium]
MDGKPQDDNPAESQASLTAGAKVPRRLLVRALVPVLVVVASVAVLVWLKTSRSQVTPTPVAERVWTVETQAAVIESRRPEIRVFGEISAGRETELRALVAGRIVELGPDFQEGARVAEGSLLVAIDDFDYKAALAEAQANRREADAEAVELAAELEGEKAQIGDDRRQLDLTKSDLARKQRLLKQGAGTEKALDEVRLTLSQREQQLESRNQTIRRLQARIRQVEAKRERLVVAAERAERNLTDTRLTAPYAGFLSQVDAAVGKRVATSDRVAVLTVADHLEAHFRLSGAQVARLMAGDGLTGRPVHVIWQLGGAEFRYDGRVERVEAVIDPSRGGLQLFARLRDIDLATPLRPGAFVTILVPDRTYDNVVAVPPRALHDRDGVALEGTDDGLLYTIKDGRLKAVVVERIARDGDLILVRADLKDGAPIVLSRFPEMGEGIAVRTAEDGGAGHGS